jgi:hypothetical protein
MKRILKDCFGHFALLSVLAMTAAGGVHAQSPAPGFVPIHQSTAYEYLNSYKLFSPPQDTFAIPTDKKNLRWFAFKGDTAYFWNVGLQKWEINVGTSEGNRNIYTVTPLHALNDSTIYMKQMGPSDSGWGSPAFYDSALRAKQRVYTTSGDGVDSVHVTDGYGTDSVVYLADITSDGWTVAPQVVYAGIPYTYNITGGVLRLNSQRYVIQPTQVKLDSSETDPRIDVFYSDTSGHSSVLKGTSAANPVKPSVDPNFQKEITFLQIPGGVGQTPALDTTFLYKNNAEWTFSNSGGTYNADNTIGGTVYEGTKSINATNLVNTNYFSLTHSAFDLSSYTSISFFIKLKANLVSNQNVQLRWYNGTTPVSSAVTVTLTRNNTITFQAANVNLTQFALSTNIVTSLRVSYVGTNGTTGFYVDYIYLQHGIPVLPQIIPVTSVASYNANQDTIKYTTADGFNHIFRYKPSVDTTDIPVFSTKVRSLFSPGIDMLYSNGVYSADTTTGTTKLATQGDITRAIAAIDTTNIPNFSVKVRSLFSPGIDMLYSNGVYSADTTTGTTKLATQGDITRAIAAISSSPLLPLTGTGTATGNVIGDLNNNILDIGYVSIDGGNYRLQIDTNTTTILSISPSVANIGYYRTTSNVTSSTNTIHTSYDNDLNYADIRLYADVSTSSIYMQSKTVSIKSLQTTGTAPTPSGTTKMVITDDNGLLSFADIPGGGGGGGGSSLFPTTGTGTATGDVTGDLATHKLSITNGNVGIGAAPNADQLFIVHDAIVGSDLLTIDKTNYQSGFAASDGIAFSAFSIEGNSATNVDFLIASNNGTDPLVSIGGDAAAQIVTVTSAGIIITNLATGGSAPTTSGTRQQVISDANGLLSFTDKSFSTLSFGATTTWDYLDGPNKILTLTGDADLVFTHLQNGDYGTLIVIQDGTGGWELTVPGQAITINTGAGDTTVLAFTYDGTTMYWTTSIGGGGGTSTIAGATDANISSPADANILLYKTSNSKWNNVAVSGDVTIGNTGATAIGASKVTNTMLAGSIAASKLVGSDIATVGTITSGTWNGGVIAGLYGGTGVANSGKTITLGGNLTTSGAFNTTFTVTGSNTITFPNASITVARTDAAQTFTGVQTFSSAPVIGSITNTGTFTLPTVSGTAMQYANATITSASTGAPSGDAKVNEYYITALAANITFSAPSGSLTKGNVLKIYLIDAGVAKTLTWNSAYKFSPDRPLPNTTVAGKGMELEFLCYDGTNFILTNYTNNY